MGRGGCLDGELVTSFYSSPVPLIGLYIAVGTLVCFIAITFDLVHGRIIQRKPFIPCKLFPMNAFTMTVLAVATKIPLDLTTSMPRAEDQLSKLTSTALMCTFLGFYMPSLGTMGTSERYGNMAALSVTVITMVVNVCIQMGTGVIFAFMIEHIIILVCLLLLLLLMWSSAIAFRGQKEWHRSYRSEISKDAEDAKRGVDGLKKLLVHTHVVNYTANPQTLICETTHHHAFGILCTLSSAVVLEAILRWLALKDMSLHCGGSSSESDYKWSISIVIVVQLLTIAVGTIAILSRWFSFVCHTIPNFLFEKGRHFYPKRELEYLDFCFSFYMKKLPSFILVAKDSFMYNVFMRPQIFLYELSSCLGIPVYFFKKVILCLPRKIKMMPQSGHNYTEQTKNMFAEMSLCKLDRLDSEVSSIDNCFVLSSVNGDPFDGWILYMALNDMRRHRNSCKGPTNLIQLLSERPASASRSFINSLEDTGKASLLNYFSESLAGKLKKVYEYKVSCVSVLVISGIIEKLMPSHKRESLVQSLHELFEVIYFVDKKTMHTCSANDVDRNASSANDEIRLMSADEVWLQWKNPRHWFRTEIISRAFNKKSEQTSWVFWKNPCNWFRSRIVSCAFKKKSKQSELKPDEVRGVLEGDLDDETDNYFKDLISDIKGSNGLLSRELMGTIAIEFMIIHKFIQQKLKDEPGKNVFVVLEECFIEMLCFVLSRLPQSILEEISGNDPIEMADERMKKALEFFWKFEKLENKIEWSFPVKSPV